MSKDDVAGLLGVSIKTVDRRIGEGDFVAKLFRSGRRVWIKATDAEAYFRMAQARGYV